jgi:hypothetical protein
LTYIPKIKYQAAGRILSTEIRLFMAKSCLKSFHFSEIPSKKLQTSLVIVISGDVGEYSNMTIAICYDFTTHGILERMILTALTFHSMNKIFIVQDT